MFFGRKRRVYAKRRAVLSRYFIPDPALLTPFAIAFTSFLFLRDSEHSVSSNLFFTLFSLRRQGNCGREQWRTAPGHNRVVDVFGMRTWNVDLAI